MIYFLALIPATALTIAGYFVLYLSSRSEGAFRSLGKYLGFWAFILAGLIVLGAIFAAAHGGRHGHMMGERRMHGGMHGPWRGDPRFFGPHREERRESGAPGDGERGAPPQAPDGASSPAVPSGPTSPSPH